MNTASCATRVVLLALGITQATTVLGQCPAGLQPYSVALLSKTGQTCSVAC